MEVDLSTGHESGPSLWVIGTALIAAVLVMTIAARVLIGRKSQIHEIYEDKAVHDPDQMHTPVPGQIASLQPK